MTGVSPTLARDGSPPPLVLAHRGACGYVPEHTLVGVAMAHALGADYVEQDVVLTRDGHAIVLHDTCLEKTTNAAELFPHRAAPNGEWRVFDFTLSEIKRLRATERRHSVAGPVRYPGRFPDGADLPLLVPTLAEEIELIQGLNRSTGRRVGLIVELKDPQGHRDAGLDVSVETLRVLNRYGYSQREDAAIVQCFDADEMRRLAGEMGCRLRLCQLLGGDAVPDRSALLGIAAYAQSIGPHYGLVLDSTGETTGLAEAARELGLQTYPYTIRRDALPAYASNATQLIDRLVAAGVNGYFTDFPDDRASSGGSPGE